MFLNAKILLSAAIVLSTVATVSAATKKNKTAAGHGGLQAHATVSHTTRGLDPDSPEATGGGSLGYNRNMYLDDW
jgi:hypothetical protein